MKRPSLYDKGILKDVAEKLCTELKGFGGVPEYEQAVDDLVDVLTSIAWKGCGYEVAKELEEYGWDPDAHMVGTLDGYRSMIHRCHDQWVEKWVVSQKITTPFIVGDFVRHCENGKWYSGEITKLDDKRATAVVFVSDLGHKKEGLGTHGVIKNWEDLISVDTPRAA